MITTLLSVKDKELLLINRFLFKKGYISADTIRWRCIVTTCKAKISTKKNNEVLHGFDVNDIRHNHQQEDPLKIFSMKKISEMKALVREGWKKKEI